MNNELTYLKEGNHEEIFNSALALARITPKEDFIDMFCSLENYTYNNKFYGSEISNEIINDLIKDRTLVFESNKTNNLSFKKKSCTCKWTCFLYPITNNNCEETPNGCGLLWLQSSTGAVL